MNQIKLSLADHNIEVGTPLTRYLMGRDGKPAKMGEMVVVSIEGDVMTCHQTDLPPVDEVVAGLKKVGLEIDPDRLDNDLPEWTFCRKTGIEIDEELGFGPTTMVATWVTPEIVSD